MLGDALLAIPGRVLATDTIARPDSMDRSLAAAQRAVSLAPSSQLAHAALASAHFFRRELGAFRGAAERALALNRMEGYTTAFLGLHFAYSGDWERGCALCRAGDATQSQSSWMVLVAHGPRRLPSARRRARAAVWAQD